MGWLSNNLSALSRSLGALATGRSPKMTASADAGWRAWLGDTPAERRTGREDVSWIDALFFNRPGHCREAIEDHLAFWAGKLARVADQDPAAFRSPVLNSGVRELLDRFSRPEVERAIREGPAGTRE